MSENRSHAKSLVASTLILVATISLSGCTINLGSNASDDQSGMLGHDHETGSNVSASGFSGADIMFAQMMIPHHQQAVDMGTLAETRAQDPAVKAIAAKIKSEQAPEIAQMKGWLKAANASLDMGHDMGMGGMMTATQMSTLEKSTGASFDKLYVQGMIGHHEGAIHMAQMVVDSNNAEAKALGAAIISSQTKQVAELKLILSGLKG